MPVEHLGQALSRLVSRLGLAEGPGRRDALDQWSDVVGSDLSSMARPCGWRRDVLLVEVDHPAAGQEIRLREKAIVRDLNARVGSPVFSRIDIVRHGKATGRR